MKRTKRKYTRKVKSEVVPDSVQSISTPLKEEINTETGEIPKILTKALSYDDLPISTRTRIEAYIEFRKKMNLPDDSKERRERAVKLFRGGTR